MGRWALPTTVSYRVRTFLIANDATVCPRSNRTALVAFTTVNTSKSASSTPRIAAWLAPSIAAPMAKALTSRGIEVVGLAGDRPELAGLAESMGVSYHTDPRSLIGCDVDAVLIADPTLGMDASVIEAMMVEAARSHTRLLTLTPRPATFGEAIRLRTVSTLPRPIGLLGDLVIGRAFFEAVRGFGAPESMQLAFDSMNHCGSPASRLYDAFDVLQELFGGPKSIAASVGGTGRISGLALFGDGRSATFMVGSNAGDCSRSMTVWSEGTRFRWLDGVMRFSDGRREESETDTEIDDGMKRAGADERAMGELAESVGWIVGQAVVAEREGRRMDVLAAVETCMLAVRTGERESVEQLKDAMNRV